MGKKHEMARRCEQIRSLIDDNQYKKALEMIDGLPLEEVGSIEDLYLFADMYEKAERMDMKKKIYYLVYERTHSRYVLKKLFHHVIRMGDMEEAREIYFAYEVGGNVTLDTFELRYLLAKAEGEPRSRLIEILSDLKKEEYTEEWGYQLALLYEMEGMREKCMQECKDLILWFGEGELIDKAKILLKRCQDPDWIPPVEEENTVIYKEPEEVERGFAAAPVAVTDMFEEEKPLEEFKDTGEVSAPMVVPKTEEVKPLEVEKKEPVVEDMEDMLEETEDVSEHGITYRTLKSTIRAVKKNRGEVHFVFAGGEERITLAVAKRIIKELNNLGYSSAKSIVKITAEKLNGLDLSKQTEKLLGGCMLITSAADLTGQTVEGICNLIDANGEQIVIMLAGPFDEMDCFLAGNRNLADKMKYKVRM